MSRRRERKTERDREKKQTTERHRSRWTHALQTVAHKRPRVAERQTRTQATRRERERGREHYAHFLIQKSCAPGAGVLAPFDGHRSQRPTHKSMTPDLGVGSVGLVAQSFLKTEVGSSEKALRLVICDAVCLCLGGLALFRPSQGVAGT